MDLKQITISDEDVQNILREALPGEEASFSGENACAYFSKARPLILTGVAILNFVHPPSAGAVSALVAMVDKLCEE